MKTLTQSILIVVATSIPVFAVADQIVANGIRFVSPEGALAAFATVSVLLTVLADYQREQKHLRPAAIRVQRRAVASLTLTH